MGYDYRALDVVTVRDVVDRAIKVGNQFIGDATSVNGERTYQNTIGPIDQALIAVRDADGISGFMARVHPDGAIREAGSQADEAIQKWLSNLAFNRDLYEAVSAFSETVPGRSLTGEAARNLAFWLRDFRRAGHELSPDDRTRLQELRNRLIELHVAYERNLDEWHDAIEVTRSDLDGLPDEYIERLEKGVGPNTYNVTVTYPDFVPFMEQARRRELRQALQFKFMNRAAVANIPLLNEAVQVRWEIARLLGYDSFAAYGLEPKMATADTLDEFYDSIVPGLLALADGELERLHTLMAEEGVEPPLMPWDWTYYDARQRHRDFGVDNNEVAKYFPLENVIDGMFEICSEMFGIEFVPVEDAQGWHEDVRLYEIHDRGENADPIAYFYADLHPRAGKYGHAACWRLRPGCRDDQGRYRTPVSAIACNFTKPTEDTPALLQHSEVETLFHEFGHVLHNTLTLAELPRFSGTQTERDFVEAPSQIMENWVWEPEVLNRFAFHYETNDPIPSDLIGAMVEARLQNIGLKTLRQVFYGKYDFALHGGDGPGDADGAYWDNIHLTAVPGHPGTHFGASFGHMMSDGYVAGYYGYLWSSVYGDDMFSVFKERGILNAEVGMRYRELVLAVGGTRDADEILHQFLDRAPSSDAFMQNIGLAPPPP